MTHRLKTPVPNTASIDRTFHCNRLSLNIFPIRAFNHGVFNHNLAYYKCIPKDFATRNALFTPSS